MSTRILIRHAQSKFNAGETDDCDSDLTERGRYQCEDAALHLKDVLGIKWPDLEAYGFIGFVSPYLRCLRTAFSIHYRWGMPFVVQPKLSEIPVANKHAEKVIVPVRKDKFAFHWDHYAEARDLKAVGMEQWHSDLKAFAKELPEDAVIVSHMDTIKHLTSYLIGKDVSDQSVSNASLTLIEDGELIFMGKR